MKNFLLDENGDLVIEHGEIQMAYGAELTAQTLKSVLGTQKGEWFLNWEEGIDLNAILGKRRYASQNSALDNQYIQVINTYAENEDKAKALNERLEKRLDGVI